MLEILTAIATVFTLILLGAALRIKKLASDEYWLYADKLVYWVLFPSFLFYKTSTIDLSAHVMWPMALTLLLGMLMAVASVWLMSHYKRIDHRATSSIVQAAGRHNTFIALAVAESLFGEQGLMIATLSTALLVPVTNITIVTSLVIILNKGEVQLARKISNDLMRNPLLIAIALGIVANALGLRHIPIIHNVTGLLASATLPLVLLCIGASLRPQHVKNTATALTISSLGKFVVFPLVILLLAWLTDLPPDVTIILLIYASVPTAASGYALARQMGGDYQLMATLITQHTLISALTLPLSIYLGARWLGITL